MAKREAGVDIVDNIGDTIENQETTQESKTITTNP